MNTLMIIQYNALIIDSRKEESCSRLLAAETILVVT